MSTPAPTRKETALWIDVIQSIARRVFAPRGVEGTLVAFFCFRPAACILLGALLLATTRTHAQHPDPSAPVVLDRVVAVVNNRAILLSDVEDEIRLSVLDPGRVGQGPLTERHALEELISRALIEQQIRQEDLQAIEPSQQEVNTRLQEIRKQLPACIRQNCATEAGWKAFLASHGLTAERVEAYLRYRLEILRFIEQRFRQGIQITQQQIEDYYHNTLLPQYAPGEAVPPLDQVASRIQEILLQQQVNVLFDNWLNNLRQQGDVEVLDPKLAPALNDPAAPGNSGRGDP
jgi:peptidyl-prolyl cis-trans isomerase SurA